MSMTRRKIIYLYFTVIRHGETLENVSNVIQGHLDTDLSTVGMQQAVELRSCLSNLKPDLLISSDLKRASNTASALELPVTVELDARLRERDFGSYCGAARRDLQQFAQANANSGNGCDGWRSIGAECSHQMAARTSAFLMDVCARMAKSAPSSDDRSVILDYSGVAAMPAPVAGSFNSTVDFIYGGHVVIVSHGGWIRQLLRLLAFQSKQSANFPSESAHSVMRNCAVCQIGLAFDPIVVDSYVSQEQRSATLNVHHASPLPAFGTLYDNGAQVSCPFAHLASPRLPLATVCYHFNATVTELSTREEQAHVMASKPTADLDPAVTLCSKMEAIFSDDGDEYAGQPE